MLRARFSLQNLPSGSIRLASCRNSTSALPYKRSKPARDDETTKFTTSNQQISTPNEGECQTNIWMKWNKVAESTHITSTNIFYTLNKSTVICCPVTRSSHQKDLAPMRHRIEGFQDTFDLRQRVRSDLYQWISLLKPKCPMCFNLGSRDFFLLHCSKSSQPWKLMFL